MIKLRKVNKCPSISHTQIKYCLGDAHNIKNVEQIMTIRNRFNHVKIQLAAYHIILYSAVLNYESDELYLSHSTLYFYNSLFTPLHLLDSYTS